MARLDEAGELARVMEPVSTVLEMTEIQTRLLAEGGPAVLARIASVDPGTVRSFLERRWRQCAPKKFLKDYDAAQTRITSTP